MAQQEFAELARRKADRAEVLAGKYPISRDILLFAARIFEFQRQLSLSVSAASQLGDYVEPLQDLVATSGPERLGREVSGIDTETFSPSLQVPSDCLSGEPARAFMARVLLQPVVFRNSAHTERVSNRCPDCHQLPQVARFLQQGHGRACWLVCSLCHSQWRIPHGQCPSCSTTGNSISQYHAEEFEHISVIACSHCHRYIHGVDETVCRDAIPNVDELVAVPLDLWAQSHGLTKIQINLAGI